MSIIAPTYASERFNSSSRSAFIPGTVLDEPVVEHEHHHIHHHIDHGSVDGKALTLSGRRDVRDVRDYSSSFDEVIDKDRRVSGTISVAGHSHHGHSHSPREHRYHNHRHRHRSSRDGGRYSRSDVDLSEYSSNSRRSSVINVSGTSDWTVIDVPPGTRRITIDTTGNVSASGSREDLTINNSSNSRNSGIRRSRGLASELWTEITKDLITREAIEELKYPFEETEYFYYIFEYLHQDQITELIELTADIRHERVKDLEFSRIANSGPTHPPPGTHYLEDRHYDRHEDHHYDRHSHVDRQVIEERRLIEERPEVVYDERTTRRSRKYYY